MQIGKEKWNV